MPSETAAPLLDVQDASRRFQGAIALDGVTFQLARGEVLALAGRNGAGKSTLVKAVIGALRLDSGAVRVLGADPAVDSRVRRQIGVAPQEIALWDHLTLSENLHAAAALGGVPIAERPDAVRRALAAAWCERCADERLGHLSGGWRRRANLAAALVHQPRLLILDEPAEGLDADTRSKIPALTRRLTQSGVGVLLVSHDMEEILALSDRILILDAGRVLLAGSCDRLMAEAFGGRRELCVRMANPRTETASTLRRLGLSDAGAGLFTALSADPWRLAAQAEGELAAVGMREAEAVVRPPGLEALIAFARTPGAFGGGAGL